MGKSSNQSSFVDRINSWAKAHANGSVREKDTRRSDLPLSNVSSNATRVSHDPTNDHTAHRNASHSNDNDRTNANYVADDRSDDPPPPAPPPIVTEDASAQPPTVGEAAKPKVGIFKSFTNGVVTFYDDVRRAVFNSWVNVLLIFIPIGIAVEAAGLPPAVVFAMNAVAVVPLAGLLAYATESVASQLGDTLGALLNVSFGNAVELIIFMYVTLSVVKLRAVYKMRLTLACVIVPLFRDPTVIALVKNEIRIVQASLLGSILANLLLILGMAFLFGGLRYQEQIYNSTVTQMSACMLSLSVMSLLLPTAFHASFSNNDTGDKATLKISRGTSVVLLWVYVLYLLFQLKSHAYLYESTPQHVIDEESHPGLLHDMLDSSSSSSSSDDSSSSDTDSTSGSHVTVAKHIRRALRHRKRRKSSASTNDTPSFVSAPSVENPRTFMGFRTGSNTPPRAAVSRRSSDLGAILSGDEADDDREANRDRAAPQVRDFENEKTGSIKSPERRKKRKHHHRHRHSKNHFKHGKKAEKDLEKQEASVAEPDEKDAHKQMEQVTAGAQIEQPHVGFVDEVTELPPATNQGPVKRPLNLRSLSSKPIKPALPEVLTNTVFSRQYPSLQPAASMPLGPRAGPNGLRRSRSLPDRMTRTPSQNAPANAAPPSTAQAEGKAEEEENPHQMSRVSAICLLLLTTGLVATCAEFLVDAIPAMTASNTSVSQAFIGLIILPIVGNAAEHITAVTVATKNKMDLAIGVAVGSSIQIAIFVTPLVVLLGWCMGRDMSLYFNLFETISLFVSAFVVNFLVLDGRSNYMEGALLISGYVIIALSAFFYPDTASQSLVGGGGGE